MSRYATDVADALSGKFCITWGVVELAMWRRRVPWSWPRILPKWFVEMRREEKKMLTVTGTAEFVNEGKGLAVTVKIQPSFPEQHDILERIANDPDNNFRLEKGVLVLEVGAVVPPAAEPESVPQSAATSASEGDRGEVILPGGPLQEGKSPEAAEGQEDFVEPILLTPVNEAAKALQE